MLLTDAVPKPIFARHETFHLRYGWLKKAYDQAKKDPQIFHRVDATVKLGVGKNMVNAIRFWSVANKILKTEGSMKNAKFVPTLMGDLIFNNENGLDPYLENPDTLWLLHWLLFAPPCQVPTWWMIMNNFNATANIDIENMTEDIIRNVTNTAEWKMPSEKSIKKDVDVFLHTYTTKKDKLSMENYLDCPFRQLFLIQQRSRDEMRFVLGKKYNLSPLITAFACLDFIDRANITGKNISINSLVTELGSVGNIFKLNEHELTDLIRDASELSDAIQIQDVNGSPQITFDSNSKEKILGKVYKKKMELLIH